MGELKIAKHLSGLDAAFDRPETKLKPNFRF